MIIVDLLKKAFEIYFPPEALQSRKQFLIYLFVNLFVIGFFLWMYSQFNKFERINVISEDRGTEYIYHVQNNDKDVLGKVRLNLYIDQPYNDDCNGIFEFVGDLADQNNPKEKSLPVTQVSTNKKWLVIKEDNEKLECQMSFGYECKNLKFLSKYLMRSKFKAENTPFYTELDMAFVELNFWFLPIEIAYLLLCLFVILPAFNKIKKKIKFLND